MQMLPMLKTLTFSIFKNVCCCLALHLLKTGPISFALDHSPLCKNDRDFNEKSDSVAVFESISSVRHFTRFPLWRRPLFVNVPF